MDKFLETVMNFINENTTLLIIICVFLIFVLIGYLIDNSIKTRKMEKNAPIENEVPVEEPIVQEEVKEEINNEEPVTEVETKVEEQPSIEVPVEEPVEAPVVPEPAINNEITVDPKINDLLLRDFSNNENTIETNEVITDAPIEEPKKEEKTVYKNNKNLFDIFKKKSEVKEETDYSTELDRILQKLNESSSSITDDSTIDETNDFTNMF